MPHPPLGLNGFGLLTEFGDTARPSRRRRYRVG